MAASHEHISEPKDSWSSSMYNQHLSFVYADVHTKPVLELLAPQGGERILDMGCGSGEITVQLQNFVGENGVVVGVDMSSNMLEKAKENGLSELFQGDIQNLSFPNDYKYLTGSFDAVFSNATLHWCKKDPGAPVRAAKQTLKPGGRFVGEFCGYSCGKELISVIYRALEARGLDPSIRDPMYFPRPEEYKRVLEAEGFQVKHISLNYRPFEFPTSLYGFMSTIYRDNFFGGMSDEEADNAMHEVCALCETHMKGENGMWFANYATVRFSAIAPS
ncbi:S-adenosyl-L-methionine-dependent methyltransferase [Rhizoctonia solani]|nr:S-adenosyl-L-methionine-dependent methyltransferase [Rhizoctonia solani]